MKILILSSEMNFYCSVKKHEGYVKFQFKNLHEDGTGDGTVLPPLEEH